MQVRTVKPHDYGGVRRIVGEQYDMEEKFVDVMTRMENVIPVPVIHKQDIRPEISDKRYRRRDIKAER